MQALPRELNHLRQRKPQEVLTTKPEPKVDFGYGDYVHLKDPANVSQLKYGAQREWRTEGYGTIVTGGDKYGGDIMVQIDGHRVWVDAAEIELLEKDRATGRPFTAGALVFDSQINLSAHVPASRPRSNIYGRMPNTTHIYMPHDDP